MVTWNTYGSWKPGDERGYVDVTGQRLKGNKGIFQISEERQKYSTVVLNKNEKKIAAQIILKEAEKAQHKIIALAVCSNHVHLLVRPHQHSIEKLIGRYKSVTTRALWNVGRENKIWAKGFDKRFCYSAKELIARLNYVQKHND